MGVVYKAKYTLKFLLSNREGTMKKVFLLVFCCSFLFSCSSNKLHQYQYEDRTAAAHMAYPPHPEVFTESWVGINPDDPVGTIINLGTTVAKDVQAAKAQAKMEQALEQVDVSEIIRRRTLAQCSKFMHYRPIDSEQRADYVFDLEIRKYGIDANSWTSRTSFKIEARVVLRHNRSGIQIWKKKIKEDRPISPSVFGLGDSGDNVLTALALSKLTVEQIATGFDHLARYTADRIADKLRDDLAEARSKEE